jgi:hypothetical protein
MGMEIMPVAATQAPGLVGARTIGAFESGPEAPGIELNGPCAPKLQTQTVLEL